MKKTLLLTAVIVLAVGLFARAEYNTAVNNQLTASNVAPVKIKEVNRVEQDAAEAKLAANIERNAQLLSNQNGEAAIIYYKPSVTATDLTHIAPPTDPDVIMQGDNDDPMLLDPPPNDECINAEVVTGPYPVTVYGTTIGATIDCPGILDFNAVWYEVDLPYTYNNMEFSYCGTVYGISDVGIIYYNDCTNCTTYIATHNFAWDCDDGSFNPRIWWDNPIPGPTTIYFPVYIGASVDFTLTINVEETTPCVVDCPAGGIPEGEPECGPYYEDTYNGGCWADPSPVFSYINSGDTICGIGGTFPVGGGWTGRDRDWYEYTAADFEQLTWTAVSEFPIVIYLYDGRSGCIYEYPFGLIGLDSAEPCDTASLSFTIAPGTYWVSISADLFSIGYDCPLDYVAWLTTGPAEPPEPDFYVTAPGAWSGNTCGAGDDCHLNYSEDHEYGVTIPYDASWTFSMCQDTDWDTNIHLGTILCVEDIAYNDDFCGRQSEITTFLTAGTYYFTLEGDWIDMYDTYCGAYTLTIEEEVPCIVDCPVEGIPEGEPDCGPGYVDTYNGGCDSEPPVFQTINLGDVICGTSGTYTNPVHRRDTDWFEYTSVAGGIFTWTAVAEFPVELSIIDGTGGCDNANILISNSANYCDTVSVTYEVGYPGTYWFYISPSSYYDSLECPLDYVAWFSGVEFAAPEFTVNPTSLEGEAPPGGSDTKVLTVGNNGEDGSTLNFTAWATIDLVSGSNGPAPDWNIGYSDNPDASFSSVQADKAPYLGAPNDPDPEIILQVECPDGSIFSQPNHTPDDYGWHFSCSDQGSVGHQYLCFDNFDGCGEIDGIMFWGLNFIMYPIMSECLEDPMTFEIKFYEDASGMPGAEVAACTLAINPIATGEFFAGFEMKEYSGLIDPPVRMLSGWISIQGISDPQDCWFYWGSSDGLDGNSHFWNGFTLEPLAYDRSFCLLGEFIIPWLTIDINSGAIPQGQTLDITATMSAGEWTAGVYTGAVNFSTNDSNNPNPIVPVTFTVGSPGYAYLPGDCNMALGLWPPSVIGGDVTYLVGYFIGGGQESCLLDGFWCSADINGDCLIIGGDVTALVGYFIAGGDLVPCPDYEPLWPPVPDDPPEGWPNCDIPVINSKVIPTGSVK